VARRHILNVNQNLCPGRCSSLDGLVSLNAEHTCVITPQKVESLRLISAYEEKARSTVRPIPSLVSEMLNAASIEVAVGLPSEPALQMRLSRARSAIVPPIPSSLHGWTIPGEFSVTSDGLPFKILDETVNGERLIIFSSMRDLQIMSVSKVFGVDGTFSSCPPQFRQLYTIHALAEDRMAPRVYALCSTKTLAMYRRLFRFLKDKIGDTCENCWQASHISIDFEAAAIKALSEIFGHQAISGCNFHFVQANLRHIRSAGQWTLYLNNPFFRTAVRMVLSMSFLPLSEVPACFIFLKEIFIAQMPALSDFFTYFEATWMADCGVWNVASRPSEIRTNNFVEGFHNRLNRNVGISHPNIWQIIRVFQLEEAHTHRKDERFRHGINVRRRTSRYRKLRLSIEKTLSDYSRGILSRESFLHVMCYQQYSEGNPRILLSVYDMGLAVSGTTSGEDNSSVIPPFESDINVLPDRVSTFKH